MSARMFVDAARSYIGSRWKHQARRRGCIDCVGLIVLAAQDTGLGKIEPPPKYGRLPFDSQLQKALQAQFGDPKTDIQFGDIAVVRWRKSEPSHVGIVGDYVWSGAGNVEHSIIHVEQQRGCIETALSGNIRHCVVETYRPIWT